MNAELDKKKCIGCELCVMKCPEVFRMGKDGYAHVIRPKVPKEARFSVREAMDVCPVFAISVTKDPED